MLLEQSNSSDRLSLFKTFHRKLPLNFSLLRRRRTHRFHINLGVCNVHHNLWPSEQAIYFFEREIAGFRILFSVSKSVSNDDSASLTEEIDSRDEDGVEDGKIDICLPPNAAD